jgi:hypothetical protein
MIKRNSFDESLPGGNNFGDKRFSIEKRSAPAVALNIKSQPRLKLGVVTHQRTRQLIVYFYQE